jgi:hypothetical protein
MRINLDVGFGRPQFCYQNVDLLFLMSCVSYIVLSHIDWLKALRALMFMVTP